jgi:acyl-CoA hydrolase
MKGKNRLSLLSILLVAAYLLSACSGVATQSSGNPVSGGKPLLQEVAFTGTVEAINASEITISGQVVSIDSNTTLDPSIKVGDIVKVEGQVSETGTVLALQVESFGADDSNTNSGNENDDNSNSNANTNSNDNSNTGNTNNNDNGSLSGGTVQEITGVVEALTADSVTINGVIYQFSSFTEFKGAVFAGDSVKLHVIVNADGSFTVREIEKSSGTNIGNDNSNDDNSNDDNSNDEDDDHGDDNSNNGNDNGN